MTALEGFLGHFDMLYDAERNACYADAVGRAVRQLKAQSREEQQDQAETELTALDVGCGCGLLGLLCWQTGAFKSVTFVDAVPDLAAAARANIQKQVTSSWGGSKSTSLIVKEGHTSDLFPVGKAVAANPLVPRGGFDLVVSELLDSVLIGEGALPSMRQLLLGHGLLKRSQSGGAAIIPARGRVMGALFSSHALFQAHRPFTESPCNDEVKVQNGLKPPASYLRCAGLHAAEHVHLAPFLARKLMQLQTKPFPVFDFDFAAAHLLPQGGRTVELDVELSGQCHCDIHGVAIWFEADFIGDGSVMLSTSPIEAFSDCASVGPPKRDHWRQAALCFKNPLRVASGPRHSFGPGTRRYVRLRASHDDDAVWFGEPALQIEAVCSEGDDDIDGNADTAAGGRPIKRARVLERRGNLPPIPRRPEDAPPLCRCGICATMSRRRLANFKRAWANLQPFLALAGERQKVVVALGDGPILPWKCLQTEEYSAVVSISRGPLAGKILGDILKENLHREDGVCRHSVFHIDPAVGRITNLTDSRADVRCQSSDGEDDRWDDVAASIQSMCGGCERETCIDVLAEPWYNSLTECWDFDHYVAALSEFCDLQSALAMEHNLTAKASGVIGEGVELWGALFQADHLWRTRQPLCRGAKSGICGLDLTALDDLHPAKGAAKVDALDGPYAVDLWPYMADACPVSQSTAPAFQLRSKAMKLMRLPSASEIASAGSTALSEKVCITSSEGASAGLNSQAVPATAHGLVLWLRCCQPETGLSAGNFWNEAHDALLARGDDLWRFRYGIALFREPLETFQCCSGDLVDARIEIEVSCVDMELQIKCSHTQ